MITYKVYDPADTAYIVGTGEPVPVGWYPTLEDAARDIERHQKFGRWLNIYIEKHEREGN